MEIFVILIGDKFTDTETTVGLSPTFRIKGNAVFHSHQD